MITYTTLSKLFPSSFTAKVFFIAFIGTHLPLILTVYFLLIKRGGFAVNSDVFIVMLIATLVGTAATLLGLRAILQPLYQVHDAMEAFEKRRERLDLNSGFSDEIGEIMTMTNRLIADIDVDLRRRSDAANTDPLTGVLNRRGFDCAITQGGAGGIIYADLDHFKSVNDTHGHDAGDLVLREAATIFSRALRSGDIVARFGGEEFVAFLPGADIRDTRQIVDRARAEIEQNVHIDGRPVTASFGIAILEPGGTVDDAIKLADKAVYFAKSAGRNRVACSADMAVPDKASA
ncbi:GGDEF domain-containing protein [Roseovarius dicentrarchi]|uniref:GGDEF domain-containing protein n=1 Tax=Roseovarius dicentrarchi TaxID=2250573 RepID=UPI00193A4671|nr:GGDEF domain-containing protein [Roseovarius dicentrarchi]